MKLPPVDAKSETEKSSILEISRFFYYAYYISDDVIILQLKCGKKLNKRYLWKY